MTDLFTSAEVAAQPERDVYTPSRLNREARTLLERGFAALWIEGEMSNLSRPSSGHWYFSIKDDAAQLRCAMFRQRNLLAKFSPRDGQRVLLRGRVTLYEPRGDYQFLVDYIEEAGEGALRRRFELLKAKLAAEGLFDTARKRPLPKLPKRIGVITSPSGAAIRDVLNILKRRFCRLPVLIYPVQVQGAGAASQIATAIRLASVRAECDVLILARGGGSLEDLWSFNEEIVARAIAACNIPIVSGVGHEVDFTIADFVADVRAPTPSGAAELAAPDCNEWQRTLSTWSRRLSGALQRTVQQSNQRLVWLDRRLNQQHPGVALRQRAQRLDELEQRLSNVLQRTIQLRTQRLHGLRRRLDQRHPGTELRKRGERLREIEQRLTRQLRQQLQRRRSVVAEQWAHLRHASPALKLAAAKSRLNMEAKTMTTALVRRIHAHQSQVAVASGRLNAVSPLATLQRGYAIVSGPNGHVITDSLAVQPGDLIEARLAAGRVQARVESIHPDEPEQE
ncbi:MAG: exodeoxyribonuclease VII large subunit [Povalibacter sp.]